ncbi:hypothetical protein BGZ80_005062 [Entomortierella chlamydospora]|uniref:Uncharacterized protein n=1 Tax=Entomortierella chlamydospora TaxID=101097 RepID=A0A9P6MLU9_9FUNG|nr:hypothetical protein BGZ80_005062 [Entomortierella chlamydospora]
MPPVRCQEVRTGVSTLPFIKPGRHRSLVQHPTTSTMPFAKITIDYYGPLPQSKEKSTHVVVIQDMFTRYVNLLRVAGTGVQNLLSRRKPRKSMESLNDLGLGPVVSLLSVPTIAAT